MRSYPNLTIGDRLLIDGRESRFTGCCETPGAGPDTPFDLKFEDFRTGAPVLMTARDFNTAYSEGRLRWPKSYERPTDLAPEAGDNDLPKARMRRAYCQAFDAAPTSKSTARLAEFIDRTGPTIGFVHKPPSPGRLRVWLRNRGETGDRRLRFMGDRIRRGQAAMRIDPVAQKVLTEKAEAFWDGIQLNQHAVYCATRAALVSINAERRTAGLPAVSPPSKATVHRYLNRHLDYGRARRRLGERVGGRPFKPIKGSMRADKILDTGIMDHSWLDVSVVDDEHLVSIGRPYLTVLIDACSRYPLGLWIGFEPPSIYSAMACLRHGLRPKLEVASEYPDIRGEWVAFGVPDTIVVDNGWEFRSGSFADACADAGISVTFAPIATPEYKAIGERFFGTLNEMLFHRLPGGVPLTPQKRREIGIDPIRDAVLTVSELKRLVYQCIVEVYGREYHKGIKAAPEQFWRKQAAVHGTPYALDLAALDRGLSRLADERTLSREGITLFGLSYRATEPLSGLLADLLPREKRRGVRWGTAKVKVKYHPEDLGQIYVWNQVRQDYVTLPCTQADYARGLSEHQHKTFQAFARDEALKFQTEDERCLARARLQDQIRAMIPAWKIGDRRRAQRMLPGPTPLALGEQVLVTEVAAPKDGIPMAGAANRRAGEKPRRAALYAAPKAKGGRRPVADAPIPAKVAAILTASDDSFADIDFRQLQEEARQSLTAEG